MSVDKSLPEPVRDPFPNVFARYLAATRPAFLTVTFAGSLIGLGTAFADGLSIDWARALVTILFALVAHAGANVVNDYFDALNGTDALNTELLHPYTGGSRFIQNGYLSLAEMRRFGYLLLAAVIPGGLWLTLGAGPGLLAIGLAGLLVAWAYSAPPFKLMSRGMGELAITAGWLLVVLGSDYVQRRQFFIIPASAALSFALLVAALLLINGCPDADADARVGKHTLAVRLGPLGAAWAYLGLVLAAHGWLAASVWLLIPPATALWGLVSLPLSLAAASLLLQRAHQPQRLKPALALTVAATLLHGVGMAAGFALVALQH